MTFTWPSSTLNGWGAVRISRTICVRFAVASHKNADSGPSELGISRADMELRTFARFRICYSVFAIADKRARTI